MNNKPILIRSLKFKLLCNYLGITDRNQECKLNKKLVEKKDLKAPHKIFQFLLNIGF